jgi:hypothetical protein
MRAPRLVVGAPAAAGGRISVEVDGDRAWLESDDATLVPRMEAFGSAFELPALHAGAHLVLRAPVDRAWKAASPRRAGVAATWWGYEPRRLRARGRGPRGHPRPGVALCFSGGVDSFHTLLHGPLAPDLLCFVHGFDVPLDDAPRAADRLAVLRAAAAARGARPVVVRSNLRDLPAVNAMPWVNTHGGALAAVGHALAGEVGTLLISATFDYHDGRPWGSHPALDGLWSATDLRIVHAGAEVIRREKLRALVGEPVAREHLRVCWENRAPTGNCGRCDKCVANLAVLAADGHHDGLPALTPPEPLSRLLGDLPATLYLRTYGHIADELPPGPRAAVQRLLERST